MEVRTGYRQVPTHVDVKYSNINLYKLNFERQANCGLSCVTAWKQGTEITLPFELEISFQASRRAGGTGQAL